MLEIQKQNEGKKLSVASELAFKVACLYKKSAGGVLYPRVKAGIGLWRMSVAFMYSSSSQCGIWHAFAAFLLLRREFVCSGERGGWEKKTMQGRVAGAVSLRKLKENHLSSPGERVGLSWEGLGSPKSMCSSQHGDLGPMLKGYSKQHFKLRITMFLVCLFVF